MQNNIRMSQLMRKILYYENILEFKENTKSSLLRSEVKNWRLCRTCLSEVDDTSAGCVDYERMTVMGMDGNLLSLHEMLLEATGAQISSVKEQHQDQLPANICKDCFGKVTTMYFFRLQTKRAEKVLKRLLAKLKEAEQRQQKVETETATSATTDVNVPPEYSSTSSNDAFMIYECDTALELAATSSEAPILKRESEQHCDNGFQESIDEGLEVVENEHFDENSNPDLIKNLADIGYIEVDEEYEETTTPEEFQSAASIDNNNEEDESDNTTPSHPLPDPDADAEAIEQEYYLEDLQQLEENTYDANSCSNDAVSIVVLNLENDQEQDVEEDMSTSVQLEQQTLASTKNSNVNRAAPVRRRYTVKDEKPLLENLKCVVCDEEFDKLHLLTKHVQQDHPTAKAFKCRVCGNVFAHMQSLSRHMRHHKPLHRKYVCDKILCGKEFLRPDDWKRHMRVHTGERPYACDQCPKAFKQPSELKEHQRSHSTEKLFQCDICNHRLFSRNGLYMHKKAHSGVKNFLCVHCDKRFRTNGELKSHSKLHLKKL